MTLVVSLIRNKMWCDFEYSQQKKRGVISSNFIEITTGSVIEYFQRKKEAENSSVLNEKTTSCDIVYCH